MRPVHVFLALLAATAVPEAQALIHSLPASLVQETLSESVPTAFSPGPLEAGDFAVEWAGPALPGVKFTLGRQSLEWVRVADVLVLPRGRLVVTADGVEAGRVANGDFYQLMTVQDGQGTAELPVAFISGERNPIRVTVRAKGHERKGELRIRFRPRAASGQPRIFTDPSCSPFGVHPEARNFGEDSWIYVGCRLVYVEGAEHRTSSLEMFVYWDNVGQSIQVGGIGTDATSVSVWPLRLRAQPGTVDLKAGAREVTLGYRVPENLHLGFFGLGVGPYAYTFDSPGVSVHSIAPVLTLYGGYFITEAMRLVAFDATSLNSSYVTDLGLYLTSESIKTLDRRISLNVMLGSHFVGFIFRGRGRFIFSAPQGAELTFRDFLRKSHNFSFGAFVYPPIKGEAYYNVWFRWGKGSFFGEVNYISWAETIDGEGFYSRAFGLSVGFPLAHFL